jgi:hypothetical protein
MHMDRLKNILNFIKPAADTRGNFQKQVFDLTPVIA